MPNFTAFHCGRLVSSQQGLKLRLQPEKRNELTGPQGFQAPTPACLPRLVRVPTTRPGDEEGRYKAAGFHHSVTSRFIW